MINYSKLLLCPVFLFLWIVTTAQSVDMETRVEARLESVLILNIDPTANIEFGIEEINDNLYQITKSPDDVNFSIESTGNWNLSISATEPYFSGVNDSSQKIPVDFIGYYIENTGNNWDNGLFSNIANKSKDTLLPLEAKENVILVNGRRNNIGGSSYNSFVLRWKFIYEDEITKMKKFSTLRIKDDYYIGGFYITLSENLTPYK